MRERKITDRFSIKENQTSSIHESNKIDDFISHCQFDTFVVLDLDNTVFEATEELGSDQWFRSIMKYYLALESTLEKEEVAKMVVTIYDEVQHHVKVRPVESEIINIIKSLQENDIPVLALTARGEGSIRPTLKHLNQTGINFYRQWGNHTHELKTENAKTHAKFTQGIIFCNGADKGDCLNSFFKILSHFPRHVLMVDDKEHNLSDVQKWIEKYGGHFTGIRYGYLDEKAGKFELEKADELMNKITHQFSDSGKEVLKKLHSIKLSAKMNTQAPSQRMFVPKPITTEPILEKPTREMKSII